MNTKKPRLIEPRLKNLIESNDFVVLRDRRSNRALHVSYSEDGLKWAVDPRTSKSLYYHNTRLTHTKINDNLWAPTFEGACVKNRGVIVEKFVPMNHTKLIRGKESVDAFSQSLEFKAVDRALRMLRESPITMYDNFSLN